MVDSGIQHRLRVAAVVRDDAGRIFVVRHARRGERFWTLPDGSPKIGADGATLCDEV
jgi:hypothetical protein